MISREEVVWLYRCLLGREPESDAVIEQSMRESDGFLSLRRRMMASREFANIQTPPVRYRPDPSTRPATRSRTHALALATIVKDEEHTIEVMLRSVLPLVEHVVVLDTGSTDGTLDLTRRLLEAADIPFTLGTIPFVDFSQARNAALDAVPETIDWVLMLDADEHLVPEDYWRLMALLDAKVDGWQLPRFNFDDRGKAGASRPYPDYQKRLISMRSRPRLRFHGAVHEEPGPDLVWGIAPASDSGPDGFIGGPHIHHMGQVDLTLARWRDKHAFYERLRLKDPGREKDVSSARAASGAPR